MTIINARPAEDIGPRTSTRPVSPEPSTSPWAGNSDDAPDESAADQPAAATEPADEDQALPVEANLAGETAAAVTQASSIDAEPGDAPVVAEAAQAVPATERPDGGDDTGNDTGGDPAGVEPTADDPDRILHVDPAELIIGANVRVDPRLDKEFLASIKADGVAEVITVYRNQERDLVVIKGQRRAAGAVAVGTPTGTVPVRVLPQPGDAERIVTQLVENIHRADMTRQETTDGFAQLSLLGMKAATIVRRTGVKKTTVDKHLAVARAEAVRQVADLLTLDQAAAMVEFDDDPQVMAALRDAAQAGKFDHVLQNARSQRASRLERDKLVADLTQAGIPIVDRPRHGDVATRLSSLGVHDEQKRDEHATTCPGHAVCLEQDWVTRGSGQVLAWVATPVCVDPTANGHELPSWLTAGSATKKAAEMTEEERTEASAERKRVRENNAAWIDAVAVRRRWLRENFLQRKAAPAGAELFVLRELLHGPHWLQEAMQRRHTVLAELLDLKPTSPDSYYGLHVCAGEFLTRIGEVSAKKATLYAAAVIFAAWERRAGDDDLGKQTWRRGSDDDRRILSQMVAWGYPPSAVEELVLVDPQTQDATAAAGDEDDPDGAGDEDRSDAGDEAGEQFVGGDVV